MIHKDTEKGFTLIETLVAITILLVSIGGPLTIAQKGISSAVFARDQITAFYLAQEAIEYIRATRDSNKLADAAGTPTGWLAGLSDCVDGVCTIDTKTDEIAACGIGGCSVLKHDGEFYTYSGGEDSTFTRSITIETISATEADIQVTINWQTASLTRAFTISEHILDW